jgi:putative transposase
VEISRLLVDWAQGCPASSKVDVSKLLVGWAQPNKGGWALIPFITSKLHWQQGSALSGIDMMEYRRIWKPGGTYFFTVVLADRRSGLLVCNIDHLRQAFRQVKIAMPFGLVAAVVLPDHLHCIWTLPEGDVDYPCRWQNIKASFSKKLPKATSRSASKVAKRERGIWQRRYWEHLIRDERDLHRHLDYIHYNPVKHGLVAQVSDWPYSSFHRYVERGYYAADWGDEPEAFDAGE